eukprot:1152517-Pelagomonas_calceolata.AAC.3
MLAVRRLTDGLSPLLHTFLTLAVTHFEQRPFEGKTCLCCTPAQCWLRRAAASQTHPGAPPANLPPVLLAAAALAGHVAQERGERASSVLKKGGPFCMVRSHYPCNSVEGQDQATSGSLWRLAAAQGGKGTGHLKRTWASEQGSSPCRDVPNSVGAQHPCDKGLSLLGITAIERVLQSQQAHGGPSKGASDLQQQGPSQAQLAPVQPKKGSRQQRAQIQHVMDMDRAPERESEDSTAVSTAACFRSQVFMQRTLLLDREFPGLTQHKKPT